MTSENQKKNEELKALSRKMSLKQSSEEEKIDAIHKIIEASKKQTINIPGLIPNSQGVSGEALTSGAGGIGTGTTTTFPYPGNNWTTNPGTSAIPSGYDPYKQQQTQPFWDNPNNKVYGPGTNNPPQRNFDLDGLEQYMKRGQKKTDFGDIIDVIFSQEEKEQALIDMGYTIEDKGLIFEISRYLADGTKRLITMNLDHLFLAEITAKFKMMLLSKHKFTIKMPKQDGE